MTDIIGQIKSNSFIFMDAGLVGLASLLLLPKVGIKAIPPKLNKTVWLASIASLGIGIVGHMMNPSGRAFLGEHRRPGGGFHHPGGGHGFHPGHGFRGFRPRVRGFPGIRGYYPYDPYVFPEYPEYPYDPYLEFPEFTYPGYYRGYPGFGHGFGHGVFHGGFGHDHDFGHGFGHGGDHDDHHGGFGGHPGGFGHGGGDDHHGGFPGGGGGEHGGPPGGAGGGDDHGHAGGHPPMGGAANLAYSYFAPAIFPEMSYYNNEAYKPYTGKGKRLIGPENVILPMEIETGNYEHSSRAPIDDFNHLPATLLSDIY
jgi:hypothetical protein